MAPLLTGTGSRKFLGWSSTDTAMYMLYAFKWIAPAFGSSGSNMFQTCHGPHPFCWRRLTNFQRLSKQVRHSSPMHSTRRTKQSTSIFWTNWKLGCKLTSTSQPKHTVRRYELSAQESSLAASGERPMAQLAELRSYVTGRGLDPGPSLETWHAE